MDIEVQCDCGNPECHANVQLRKGYVHIRHPDGRTEERWDHFYIDASDMRGANIELMLPPREARRIMWFLVREYLPVVRHAVEWWWRYPVYWWWSAKDRLREFWRSRVETRRL